MKILHITNTYPFEEYQTSTLFIIKAKKLIEVEKNLIRVSGHRILEGILQICLSKIKKERKNLCYSNFLDDKIIINKSNSNDKLLSLVFKKFQKNICYWKFYKTQFNYINPLFYFLFIQERDLEKFKNLNLGKIKKYLWKR